MTVKPIFYRNIKFSSGVREIAKLMTIQLFKSEVLRVFINMEAKYVLS
jgi:hypothetical protein